MISLNKAVYLFLVFALTHIYAQESAVVFMYHRFGESKYPSTNIKLEQFEAHLEYLKQNGYKVVPLSEIVSNISKGSPIPEKSVAITIDDAYKSVYTQAFPRLKAKGFPFTVFVNTASIDNDSKNYMSWSEMREMKAHQAEFANHSTSHDYLLPKDNESKEQWQKRLRDEVENAQHRLQEELGDSTNKNPKLLSYPFGEYTLESAEFIKSLGYIGITQTSGSLDKYSDHRFLPRFPMAELFGDMEGFVLKLKTLPLPIKEVSSKEPLVVSKNPPILEIELKYPLENIGCYLSNGEPLIVKHISKTKIEIKAKQRLQSPRDKYTCTAQVDKGRWYWYSHLWIVK